MYLKKYMHAAKVCNRSWIVSSNTSKVFFKSLYQAKPFYHGFNCIFIASGKVNILDETKQCFCDCCTYDKTEPFYHRKQLKVHFKLTFHIWDFSESS